MSFAVGQIVVPARRYVGRDSVCTVSASGRRTYHERELYDMNGVRSAFGLIQEVMGNETSERWFFDRSGRVPVRSLVFNGTAPAWTASTAYAENTYVTSGGKLWRCTVGGTSDVTGPSGAEAKFVELSGVTWFEALAPENSDGLTDVFRSSPLYRVRVWDINARALTSLVYAESELAAFTSFEEWRQLGSGDPRSANPTNVLPFVASGHIDVLTDDKVRELARAYELTGVDPRG